MKLLFSDSAYRDLAEIKEYYEEEGVPDIGANLISEIVSHIQVLRDNPDIGRVVPEFEKENIGELIHPPFRIVYLRECEAIHVIRVWRSERLLVLPDDEV